MTTNRPPYARASIREFPPYRLDPANQYLWRRNSTGEEEQVPLPPKAFDLLHYFAANPHRVITHDELLEALWPGVHVQPEVVKGQILTLRHMLGDDAGKPRFIETVRGRGYRFIAAFADPDDPVERPSQGHGILVARDEQISLLRRQLRESVAGQLRLIFVTGEAGVGKTALIDEFIEEASVEQNFLVVKGQCVEGFSGIEPYYPVLEALGRLCRSSMGDAVVRGLVSSAPTWAMQLPAHIPVDLRAMFRSDIAGAGRERMLREICDFFDDLPLSRPLLIILEDLHWADNSTVDFLSALGRRGSRAKLMIVVTYRPEDEGSSAHPVKLVSNSLALRKLGHEIVLQPLTEAAVARFLAGGEKSSPTDPEFAALVHALSGGNPLFMSATLDHLVEHGLAERVDNRWRTSVPLDQVELRVPKTLSQVVEARIRRLTEDQRTVLQAAAIAGVSFSPTIAARATDRSADWFEDICEELCRQEDFLHRDDASASGAGPASRAYAFRHALYRQVFYDRQGRLRLSKGHHAIGKAIEESYPVERRGEVASELAQHFGDAEEWALALAYLQIGLQTAKRRFANHEALEILDKAMLLVGRLPPAARPDAEMALLEARAAVYMVEHDLRAEPCYRQLADLASQNGKIDIKARALLGLAYATSWRDQKLALEILDRALAASDDQTDAHARNRTRLSGHAWRIWIGGWNSADAQQSEEALNELRSGSDPVAAAWASLEFSIVAVISTRYREAEDAVKLGYQQMHLSAGARPEFSLERAVWSYFLGIPLSTLLLGEFGKSLEAFNDGIALFSRSGNVYAVATLRLYRAWLALHCMDFQFVLDECADIAAAFAAGAQGAEAPVLPPAEHRLRRLLIGLAEVGLGRNAEALDSFGEVSQLMERQPVIFDWYWRMPLEMGLSHAWSALGQLTEAKEYADRFVRNSEQSGDRTWHGLAWRTAARTALSRGETQLAIQSIERALSAVDGFDTPLADWQVLEAASAVYAASGRHEEAREHAELAAAKREELARTLPDGSRLRSTLTRSPAAH